MSFYRQRWRIDIEGMDEPVEVTTSARDSQEIVVGTVDGQPQMPLGVPLKIVHNALLRTETPGVPRNFQRFLDIVLDANEVPDDEDAGAGGSGEETDPTRLAVSDA
jgi:hypothetical protein